MIDIPLARTVLGTTALLLCAACSADPARREPTPAPTALADGQPCPVTRVAERTEAPPERAVTMADGDDSWFGGGGLWAWSPGRPVELNREDGRLSTKWGWWRGVEGDITLAATSLRTGASVETELDNSGYGPTGFQPSVLDFPEAGCWRFDARLGDAAITFVAELV
ncbi:hypothetical protein [Actinocorallia sp. A-T 12471]|uniref:hypothetical protein n=1 Tax=Actinocorallia sp. A-T 12471 TaxID=3089813 RepID=UPI0029CC5D4F|nr:hypothetical protein [Actinocorallia sp. A-T 12471]MDX6740056.1 hypothetical protein [Actinocorallia sp. A-T 12471]